jgi:hypothetical protein
VENGAALFIVEIGMIVFHGRPEAGVKTGYCIGGMLRLKETSGNINPNIQNKFLIEKRSERRAPYDLKPWFKKLCGSSSHNASRP